MEKHVSGLLMVIAVFALLIGGLVGYDMAPTKILTKTVTDVQYKNVSVDRIVNVRAPSQLNKSITTFLTAVKSGRDESGHRINVLGNYNFNEIEVSKVFDRYNVNHRFNKVTTNFKIQLRFKQAYEPAIKRVYNVTVVFVKDDDSKVLIN